MSVHNRLTANAQNFSVILIWVAVVILFLSGCGDKKPKVSRVGILSGTETLIGIVDGFKQRMGELGYEEGRDILYDLQKTNIDPPAERKVLEKFVADKADLIFVFPTAAALAARAATQGTNIPVVFTFTTLEGNNLVNSVSEPGGNMTGVRFPGPDLVARRFELLMQMVPQVKRLWVAYVVDYPTTKISLDILRTAALSVGVTLVEIPVVTVADIRADLHKRAKLRDCGMDAIMILPEILSQSQESWAAISRFAAEHRLPIAGSLRHQADQGALFAYSPGYSAFGRLAANLADKVLKGIPAGTIPVLSPESVLRINHKCALALGIKVPEGVLKMADEVIR
jgi:putative tryptophan/tyrosine transport system substrate-binding protein